ncbi:hypothetical protein EDB85DRAFT_2279448 [Lactarius pseudohatsudake]|nr:hypothetical protein EDB85DRAFT_2279448 [Lactarius pseudohatsudake]
MSFHNSLQLSLEIAIVLRIVTNFVTYNTYHVLAWVVGNSAGLSRKILSRTAASDPLTAVANPATSPIPPRRHSRRPPSSPPPSPLPPLRRGRGSRRGRGRGRAVIAQSSRSSSRGRLARRGRVVVAPSRHRRTVVAPSSYPGRCRAIFAPSVVVLRVVVVRLAPRRVPRIAFARGPPPLLQANTVAGTQSTTPPRPVPWPHPRRDAGLRPIKIPHKPVAAASNPSPRTSPPPPPPPTARKSRRNATPTACNPRRYDADADGNQVDDDDDAEGDGSCDVEGDGGGDAEGSGDGDAEGDEW